MYIVIMLIKNFDINNKGMKNIDILLLKLRLNVRDILKNGVEEYQFYQDKMNKLFMKEIMILMKNTNDKTNIDINENKHRLIDKIIKLFGELIQIIMQVTIRKMWINKFNVLIDDLCEIDNKRLGYHNKQGMNAKLRGIREKYKIPMQLVGRIFCLKKYPVEKMIIITLVDMNSMLVKLSDNTQTKVWIDQLYNVEWISMTSYLDTDKDILKRVINLENKSLRMIKAGINTDYRYQTGSSTMVEITFEDIKLYLNTKSRIERYGGAIISELLRYVPYDERDNYKKQIYNDIHNQDREGLARLLNKKMLRLHNIMRSIIPMYLKGGMKQDKLNKPPTISIKHDHTYYSLEEYEKMEDTKQQLLNDERYFGTEIELDILRRDGKDFELIIVARGSLADAEQNIRERQEEKEQKELDSGLIDDEERDEYNKDNIQMIKDRR